MPQTAPPGLHPGRDKGYALDFQTPVRHVVTQLEEARQSGRAPSLDVLTESYTSALPSDLHRVKLHELGIRHPQAHVRDEDARAFLMAKAIEALGDQVECQEDGTYVLTIPLEAVRYAGKPVHLFQHDRVLFGDPYNPLTDGTFTTNTRTLSRDTTLPELRESMRIAGWLDGHPAIKDERGVVIVGHRRLQIAEELGIEPKIEIKYFGAGDDADRGRSLYALFSNRGNKPLTPEDRKRWTRHLYHDEKWDEERIAEALKVSVATVSRDLSEFTYVNSDRSSHPGGRGKRKLTPEQEDEVGNRRATGEKADALAREYGVSRGTVYAAGERARGRQEVRVSLPSPTPATNGLSPDVPCPHCHGTGLVSPARAGP